MERLPIDDHDLRIAWRSSRPLSLAIR